MEDGTLTPSDDEITEIVEGDDIEDVVEPEGMGYVLAVHDARGLIIVASDIDDPTDLVEALHEYDGRPGVYDVAVCRLVPLSSLSEEEETE